jgi:hypothetical protein
MFALGADIEVAESRAVRITITRMAHFLYGESDVSTPSPIMAELIVISRRSPIL